MQTKQPAECDCCQQFAILTQVWVNGCETWACDECRGIKPDDYDEREPDNSETTISK